MSAEAVSRICAAISGSSLESAAALARAELPFAPTERSPRRPTKFKQVSVFLRDGFVDRYTGEQLIFPGTLRLVSHLLPTEIPYHPNWKRTESHSLFWDLQATLDHVCPVALGGSDELDNLVSTSMNTNQAKGHRTLKELRWRLQPAGELLDWDGLLVWFMKLTSADPSLLDQRTIDERALREQRVLKEWRRAAERALHAYGAERLPTSLRPFATA